MLIVHHVYAVCAFMFAFDFTLGVKAITLVIQNTLILRWKDKCLCILSMKNACILQSGLHYINMRKKYICLQPRVSISETNGWVCCSPKENKTSREDAAGWRDENRVSDKERGSEKCRSEADADQH